MRWAWASAWAAMIFRSASRRATSVSVVCYSSTAPRRAASMAALACSSAVRYWA